LILIPVAVDSRVTLSPPSKPTVLGVPPDAAFKEILA